MTARFDPIIHPRNRLLICAVLAPLDEAEFAVVREEVGVSDSVLSKQVRYLEEAGYVTVRKWTVDTRQRTWLALTKKGRAAFTAHVAELKRLLDSDESMQSAARAIRRPLA